MNMRVLAVIRGHSKCAVKRLTTDAPPHCARLTKWSWKRWLNCTESFPKPAGQHWFNRRHTNLPDDFCGIVTLPGAARADRFQICMLQGNACHRAESE